jgi:hypothetical protein
VVGTITEAFLRCQNGISQSAMRARRRKNGRCRSAKGKVRTAANMLNRWDLSRTHFPLDANHDRILRLERWWVCKVVPRTVKPAQTRCIGHGRAVWLTSRIGTSPPIPCAPTSTTSLSNQSRRRLTGYARSDDIATYPASIASWKTSTETPVAVTARRPSATRSITWMFMCATPLTGLIEQSLDCAASPCTTNGTPDRLLSNT